MSAIEITINILQYIGGVSVLFFEFTVSFIEHDAFRNLGLLAIATITVKIATRRLKIAEEDKKTSIKQAYTSEAGLNIDRFQKGAAMLASDNRAARQGGILILHELASSIPETYLENVYGVLNSYVYSFDRSVIIENHQNLAQSSYNRFTPDYSAALVSLLLLNKHNLASSDEPDPRFMRDLFLPLYDLSGFDMSTIDFSNSVFQSINFKNARLRDTNFSGVKFVDSKNLTYAQLSQAKNVDPEFLAKLKADEEAAAAKATEENTPT